VSKPVHNCTKVIDDRTKDIKDWTGKARDNEADMGVFFALRAGMTKDAVLSLSETANRQIRLKINGNCVNLPAVIGAGGDDLMKCKLVLEKPQVRLQEILAETARTSSHK
jgi:hypothetical protein